MEEKLIKIKNGRKAEIKKLDGNLGFKKKLACLNIRVGKIIKKIAAQPLRGPIIIEIDGRSIALGRGMASKIIVDVIR